MSQGIIKVMILCVVNFLAAELFVHKKRSDVLLLHREGFYEKRTI